MKNDRLWSIFMKIAYKQSHCGRLSQPDIEAITATAVSWTPPSALQIASTT